MPLLSEKPIFVITSALAGIQKLGKTPYGERRIINILGGTVEGESSRASSCRAAPTGRSCALTAWCT